MRTSARPPDLRGKRTREQLLYEQNWKLKNLRAELYLEDTAPRYRRSDTPVSNMIGGSITSRSTSMVVGRICGPINSSTLTT